MVIIRRVYSRGCPGLGIHIKRTTVVLLWTKTRPVSRFVVTMHLWTMHVGHREPVETGNRLSRIRTVEEKKNIYDLSLIFRI